MIKLAIPIFNNDKKYVSAEIVKPSGGVLADTKKVSDTGDVFSATRVFLIGCITSLISDDDNTITDKVALKSLINKMPYKTAEQLTLEVVKLYNGSDDGIEGVYYCPRCHHQIIAELINNDGMEIDTRDFISNLQTEYYDGDGILRNELTEPVLIKNSSTGDVYYEIKNYSMRFPTIEDGIQAFQKYGSRDEVRLQFSMFTNSLLTINDEEVNSKFKNATGLLFFESMKDIKNDIVKITDEINSYGIIPEIDKHCPKCGKDFKAIINTSNFFDSALRPM